MSDSAKRILMNTAIVLLFLNAVFLTALCWFSNTNSSIGESIASMKTYIGNIFERTDANDEVYDYIEYAYSSEILSPLRGAIRTRDGLASMTDRESASQLFESVSGVMTSAFDTAVMNRELSTTEWRGYLKKEMVLFDFQGSVPLYSLAAYLGTGRFDTLYLEARYLMLVQEDENILLCVKTADGHMYAYSTSASADINSLSEAYPADGSMLGIESRYSTQIPAECIIISGFREGKILSESAVITDFASTGTERMVNGILEAFGFNTYSTGGYIESDSTHVYVEALNTLRIHPDGSINYTAGNEEAGSGNISYEDKAAMVSEAVEIATQIMSGRLGDAGLYISRTYTSNGDFVVLFGYECDGTVIECENGYCARFVFRNLKLEEAQIKLTEYESGEEREIIIPDIQAAALAAESGNVREFELRYKYSNGSMHCAWYCD